MKKKNPSVYQPKPTIDQLKTWATPRLLRFYKSERSWLIGRWYEWGMSDEEKAEYRAQEDYVETVRVLLNSREHVSETPAKKNQEPKMIRRTHWIPNSKKLVKAA
jgi:hypothetical protein